MTDLSGQSLGRYDLLEPLGEGGMATVYKAYDMRLETDVAVKVIRTENLAPNVLERALKRFEREAKSLARLTHPNIVKVTDYGEYEGRPYLVMPYLPGGTLKERLGKPIPWQDAARLLLPIARALDFAHRQNLIHRDVKPSNILTTADGEPMLTDFGIAKVLDLEETADLTGTGMGIGTPEYMAPEQWTGQTTQQSDQYSLGVVFYEMLTGRKPYSATTPAAILLKQANDPLPRPSQFVRGLPDKVEKLILKAMAKNPADRFPSMSAFAIALDTLLSGSTAQVKPQSATRREQTQTVTERVVEEKTMRAAQPFPFAGGTNRNSALLRYWPLAVAGIFIVLLSALLLNFPKPEQPAPTQAPTEPVAPPAVELSPIANTPAINSNPEQIIDSKGVTMRLVPAGTFSMGSNNGSPNEKPVHEVYLDAYYMDSYEVTNKLYKACVDTGVCDPPKNVTSSTRPDYYENLEFDNYPVIYVDWNMAKSYCEWRGGSLPTEAQWEKAARGTDGRTFPWGEENDKNFANSNFYVGDTTLVGNYNNGKSPYGLYDIAGNVREWTMDWYDANYYAKSPTNNPQGPASGQSRVLRGGSWADPRSGARSTVRYWSDPSLATSGIGFRCAHSANSPAQNSVTESPVATEPSAAASNPEQITDLKGMTMRLVPAGTFTMGSNDGTPDEQPVHNVYLDAYYMDVYEVTNKLYKVCVDVGVCDQPKDAGHYNDSNYANHPVVYIDWNMAKNYCEWRGVSLPTEAQWEKAARGTDGRTYPWGEGIDLTRANYNKNVGDTTAVGSYQSGISPYGFYDMAGNVWEWVADWYSETFYQNMPLTNPFGPGPGQSRVLRGGAWYDGDNSVRAALRYWDYPTSTSKYIGFRCARPADSSAQSTVTESPVITKTLAVASNPEEITDPKGVTMRLVLAGTFKMGSDNGNPNEKPAHDVYLDSYYMDVYEVTNKLYKDCVGAGVCDPPKDASTYARSSYYGNSKFDNYPVINVDWIMAENYCEWRGGNLPTEAQWEKAARGTDGRTYPWGEGIDSSRANFNGNVGDTTAVDSYESGISPYGLYNMAGNVSEWVADWYLETFYQGSSSANPLGPDTGQYHVIRGGAWGYVDSFLRSASRVDGYLPTTFSGDLGIRCARARPSP